jgi:ATP:ADP antiporter, AAA family
MTSPGAALRRFVDIRQGEHLRLWAMFFYLLFVLFAYYIVKPVSRAMFLTKFDIDKLPSLYILIAIFGGILAYFYSRVATKTSLNAAVAWTMGLSTLTLVVMWYLIHLRIPWMVYVLNIWVSIFSVILVSQGWLVAGNLFDARQAKRLYPFLDMGMVIGAAFGGEFTKRMVSIVGTEGLLLASAVMVILAYVSFMAASRDAKDSLRQAAAASRDRTEFSVRQMLGDFTRVRHLRIIVGMMIVMYLVDTLVEYQFQAMARTTYRGDQLTAYFGQFYGLWLNGVEFIFQLFLTGVIVRWFGIGATLQISPIAVGLSSVAILAAPGVMSASAVRLTEASTRYTLSKTGMELLYMPLPLALRNRIKAFIDICVDRLSRGIGGVLLLLLTTSSLHLGVRGIAWIVIVLSAVWVVYAVIARREYIASVRQHLERRRVDFASTRISVTDGATIGILEAAACGTNARQASYALSLLEEAPGYDVRPVLMRLVGTSEASVRQKVYEIGTRLRFGGLLEYAAGDVSKEVMRHAIGYLLTVAPQRMKLGAEYLNSDRPEVVQAALEGISSNPDLTASLISEEWIAENARSSNAERRSIAAAAIAVRDWGGPESETLHRLLDDTDTGVALAALRSAGKLRNRAYLFQIIRALNHSRLRGEAIRALTAFGPGIAGTLYDVLRDEAVPSRTRRQVPRILRKITAQESVNVLLTAIGNKDLTIRSAALKALNGLREAAPQLNYDDRPVTEQLMNEARTYYELSAALEPVRRHVTGDRSALSLLARSIEGRLRSTFTRLFRLLGLRYPPREIYSSYLAIAGPVKNDSSAALEFLDSVLDQKLKRVLLPLLDAPQNILDGGRDLFDVRIQTVEDAVRTQILSGDPWMSACAMAAAGELQLRNVSDDIARMALGATPEVSLVARRVQTALAAAATR